MELGAGCGLVGLVTAKLQQQSESSVILTDFNQKVLENLERNIALNNVADNCIVKGLDFYQQSGSCSFDTAAAATATGTSGGWKDLSGTVHAPVDVVLAADMICQPSDAMAAVRYCSG